jgi:hypothetical protein
MNAVRLARDPTRLQQAPATALVAAARIGDDLYIDFTNKRLRVYFGFDRGLKLGLICVDDISRVGIDGAKSIRLKAITFRDDKSASECLVDGKALSLTDPSDGLLLALNIVDIALDYNPDAAVSAR